jgi:hypothetical protein
MRHGLFSFVISEIFSSNDDQIIVFVEIKNFQIRLRSGLKLWHQLNASNGTSFIISYAEAISTISSVIWALTFESLLVQSCHKSLPGVISVCRRNFPPTVLFAIEVCQFHHWKRCLSVIISPFFSYIFLICGHIIPTSATA